MNAFTEARMHLGVELRGAGTHPAALRHGGVDPAALVDPAWWTRLVRDAAARGLDLVVLPDGRPEGAPIGVLDAVALAERIAPFVPGIGLVPQVDVAAAEPTVLSKAISTLAVVSAGRAGWEPVTTTGWREAGPVIEGVLDEEPVDDGVRRLPRRRPLTVVRADGPDALEIAARHADVVRIAAPGLDAAQAVRERVRDAAAAAGRHPDHLTVLLDVEVHLADDAADARGSLRRLDRSGELPPSTLRVVGAAVELANLVERTVALRAADGITFLPLALPADLLAVTGQLVPILAGRGLFRTGSAGTPLRARFQTRRLTDTGVAS
jgi:alkanesulfonate monooxygenase SsuD/methylene tetrahydromethanopterin reductase-like flavin-dependent oxidoreductase (luciferase family)